MDYLIIQLEQQRVRAARFGIRRNALSCAGAVEFELTAEQPLSHVAARLAEGLQGAPRVVLCLPPQLFAQRQVDIPLDDLRKVREVLPAHLQGEIAIPAEEAVFDALPLESGRYLALWARKEDIAQIVALFRDAGCEPQIVTAAPFAWPYLPDVQDGLVSDGSALAQLCDGQVTMVRPLEQVPFGPAVAATCAMLDLAGLPDPQRLTLFGAALDYPPDTAELPLTVNSLGLSEQMAPLFATESVFQQAVGLLAVARACHAGQLPDFRRNELAWTSGDVRLRRQLLVTAVLAGIAVVLLFAGEGLRYRAARNDLASLNKSIAAIYREVFPARTKAVDEVSEIKGEIRKMAGSDGTSGILDVLKQLADLKGATINGLYEAELDGRNLRLKGDARSIQAVNDFKAAVTPLMATVEAGEVKSRPDGTVTFSLWGSLKEAGR